MLDTNIFISAIFFPSVQTRELVKRLTDNYRIVICDYVIEELRLVTERKFPDRKVFLDHFFVEFSYDLVYTPKVMDLNNYPQMRDQKDSPILATLDKY
jgi:predicted nucleic acid-binding protein